MLKWICYRCVIGINYGRVMFADGGKCLKSIKYSTFWHKINGDLSEICLKDVYKRQTEESDTEEVFL